MNDISRKIIAKNYALKAINSTISRKNLETKAELIYENLVKNNPKVKRKIEELALDYRKADINEKIGLATILSTSTLVAASVVFKNYFPETIDWSFYKLLPYIALSSLFIGINYSLTGNKRKVNIEREIKDIKFNYYLSDISYYLR